MGAVERRSFYLNHTTHLWLKDKIHRWGFFSREGCPTDRHDALLVPLADACVALFQAVLATLILSKWDARVLKRCRLFKRILIQDSTIIQLPPRLFDLFSGVKNAHTTTCNARIQGVYDLCSGRFVRFSIDPYSKNDVSVAFDLPVEPGDLVLRDRGYFLLEAISNFKAKGVETISRYKHKTTLYDASTRESLDLLDLLTRSGSVDRIVLASENKDIRVRLLAVPVTEEIANLRSRNLADRQAHHDLGLLSSRLRASEW